MANTSLECDCGGTYDEIVRWEGFVCSDCGDLWDSDDTGDGLLPHGRDPGYGDLDG
ncbi:uncharacterized protein Nmag_0246 [Natrialba magadii ATCC 43099]|uniref:Uncharacterized protein n=1 Tax=Natrialba magadii (strain ATCC 43099 / DSM 3394 / CCM 3739 / CIP 104546 / IAM 13178 / JCM 8861 / NBRC 102185 / NCIMB 2190 / MS3) TaxID=547559 RepID=D3SX18_NATMM|nr:uncharacterized protein Nmag_0246 [Natrialba magadii ATCC 43099]